MFLFEVPTGIFGDKYGRKNSIVVGLIGWIIFTIGLLFADTFWEFFFLFMLWGINVTFASGSDEAMIYDSLKQVKKEKQMQKYMGKIISARFLPLIIIAPFGSIIAKDLTSFQFTLLILGNLLFTIIAFFISLSLVEPKAESGPHEIRSPFILFKMSIQHLRNSPKLVSMFINKTLILIPGSHIFGLLWQPYLQTSGVSVALFGTLTAVASLIIYLLSRNIDAIESKVNGRKIIFYTGLLPLIAFVLGALFQNIFAALFFYFVIKVAIWLRNPVFSQYMNEHIESHNRATVLSSLSMIDSLFDVVIFLSAAFITQ
ncbi:MFS transporter, partial [Candidatus Woesearchaeota archaeon]|nr:MFS transporter [Candidatus Woesearchaeota archaeon]